MRSLLKRFITSVLLVTGFCLFFFLLPPIYLSALFLVTLFQILFTEWPQLFPVNHWLFWVLMPLYPITPFLLLIVLNQSPIYHPLILYLCIIVASHDTGSYIIGNLIGRHPIAPRISPGKTWEGFWGGYVCTLIIFISLFGTYIVRKSWILFTAVFLTICILSLLGDLFESYLKRHAGIKDSGSILPGHGGILDRFDGILFAVLFFYIFKDYLIEFFKLQ